MGTRTYSRRGNALAAVDIFGNKIPERTPPAPTPEVTPPPAPVAPRRTAPARPRPVAPTPPPAPATPRPVPPRLTTNAKDSQRDSIGRFEWIELTPEQVASLKAHGAFDYGMKPDNAPPGPVRPQGPMKIDMARMSPEEITDQLLKYAKDHTWDETIKAFFESARHPNAARPNIDIQGFSKDTKKVIQTYADAMFGLFDAAKLKPMPILKYKGNSRKIGAEYKYSVDFFSRRVMFQQIGANSNASPDIILHETAHALERHFDGITPVLDMFGQARTTGLPSDWRNPMSGRRSPSNHVDHPYTLVTYPDGHRHEVFSMGFESIYRAKNIGDRQLIENTVRAIQEANGYYR